MRDLKRVSVIWGLALIVIILWLMQMVVKDSYWSTLLLIVEFMALVVQILLVIIWSRR